MPSCKALKLTIELDVNMVSCPGVWLPNKGDVLVRLWLLDRTSRTTSLLPVFPLVYHENFVFQKVFGCQRLPDLHSALSSLTMRAELQQLRSGHVTTLATFECSLLTLLFPEVDHRPGLRCSEQVELCMLPQASFPGMLPPKLEISTRTLIEEVLGSSRKSCVRKTISSEAHPSPRCRRDVQQLARQAHSLRTPSPRRVARQRPPFVVRHVDEDIFKYQPPASHRPRQCPACRGVRESPPDGYLSDSDTGEDLEQVPLSRPCPTSQAYKCHCDHACTVCRLYLTYFGTNYPRHRLGSTCNCPSNKSENTQIPSNKYKVNGAPTKCSCHCEDSSSEISDDEGSSSDVCKCHRQVPTCQCDEVPVSCSCKPPTLSEWCRMKKKHAKTPYHLDTS